MLPLCKLSLEEHVDCGARRYCNVKWYGRSFFEYKLDPEITDG